MTQNVLDSIPVRLGTLAFDIHTDQPDTHAILADRFQGFLRTKGGLSPRVHVARSEALPAPFYNDADLHVVEPSFALRYQKAEPSTLVTVFDRDGRFTEDPLLTGLLHYVSLACVDHGSLLVHAGAVEISGRALVFPGKSGAGKSTLAGMFPVPEVLNDEFVILETEPVMCASTPFYGTSMPHRRGRWALHPILSLLQLRHGETARLSTMESGLASVSELLGSVVVPGPETAARWQNRAFELALPLARQRWHRLTFPLEPTQTIALLRALT